MIRKILNYCDTMSRRFRRFVLCGRGFSLPADTRVEAGVELLAGIAPDGHAGQVHIGAACQLSRGVVLHAYGGRIALGQDVFLGPYAVIYGHGGVEIGDHTLVSMHCRILSSNHAIPGAAVLIRSQPDILQPTKIGADVWLGAGVTVLGGVTIGDGCVVGAGAVVTDDLPPGAVAVGVPARVIRHRPGNG
jgi:serine acetyltransferase